MSKKILLVLVSIFFLSAQYVYAKPTGSLTVNLGGSFQTVDYEIFVPELKDKNERLPVLICVGGLPTKGKQYLRGDTAECLDGNWRTFAAENRVAILGLGFQFIREDWERKESYQYAQVWSGKAVLKILELLKDKYALNPNELYLFGISAGAQFSIRFAQTYPEIARGVVANAAGGYDWPQQFIPTKILITVGDKDNGEITRLEMAKEFERLAKEKGMDVTLKIIPGIAHIQTEGQNEMAREFYKNIISSSHQN